MSSYFNLSSPTAYLSGRKASTGSSPAGLSPVSPSAPTVPTSTSPVAAPSDSGVELKDPLQLWRSDLQQTPIYLLVKRLREVESLADALANYFEGPFCPPFLRVDSALTRLNVALANAHQAHSTQLQPIAQQKALLTSQSWIPVHNGGYAALIDNLRETSEAVAAEHAVISKRLKEDVVTPIRKTKEAVELKRKEIEKEAKGMPEAVLKERDATNAALMTMTEAVNSIMPQQPASDPVLLRYQFDSQLKVQLDKENDLLARAQRWTTEARDLERATFDAISTAWTAWGEANSNMLLSNQQRSVLLSATIDSIPSDAEWNHFASSTDSVVPADAEEQHADSIDIPTRDDPTTKPLREGPLERQKGWVKTWKPVHAVLTPSGNLHAFAEAVTSKTTGTALKPLVSVPLSQCTLAPLPNDDSAFVLEAPEGKTILRVPPKHEQGQEGIDKDREEWCTLIEKFTKDKPSNTQQQQQKEEVDLGMASVAKGLPSEPDAPETPKKAGPPLPARSASSITSPVQNELLAEADIDASSLSLHSVNDLRPEDDDDDDHEGDIGASASSPRQRSHRLSTANSSITASSSTNAPSSLYSRDDDYEEGDITSHSSFGPHAASSTAVDNEENDAGTPAGPSTSASNAGNGKHEHKRDISQSTSSSAAGGGATTDDDHDRDDEEDDELARPSPFEFSEIPDSPSRPSFEQPAATAHDHDHNRDHDRDHDQAAQGQETDEAAKKGHSKKSSLASVTFADNDNDNNNDDGNSDEQDESKEGCSLQNL